MKVFKQLAYIKYVIAKLSKFVKNTLTSLLLLGSGKQVKDLNF